MKNIIGLILIAALTVACNQIQKKEQNSQETLKSNTMETPKDAVIQLFIATDSQDWSQVEKVFDRKVILDYSSMNGNPATELAAQDIIASWKTVLPGFDHTHHQLGNFQSSLNGNSAHVFCYGTTTHYLEDEKGNVWIVVGSYDFDLIKDQNQAWRITSMKFNFKYMDGNTSLPEKAMNYLK